MIDNGARRGLVELIKSLGRRFKRQEKKIDDLETHASDVERRCGQYEEAIADLIERINAVHPSANELAAAASAIGDVGFDAEQFERMKWNTYPPGAAKPTEEEERRWDELVRRARDSSRAS